MNKWVVAAIVVLGGGVIWYVLTMPADEPSPPGSMSSHQVEQPFDPFLADNGETGGGDLEEEYDTPREAAEPNDDAPADRSNDAGRNEAIPQTPEDEPSSEREQRADDAPQAARLNPADARRLADFYLRGAAVNPDHNLTLYADRVNYYDQGTVDRDYVLQDKRSYLRRWPERSYERTSDVKVVDAGTADLIRFNYRFRVSGGSRTAEGRGWAELGVQREGGELRIVSERGGVLERAD